MDKYETKYMFFSKEGVSTSGKTEIWYVTTVDGETLLGEIKWFARWRCYSFFPMSETVFSMGCLRDIEKVLSLLKKKKQGRDV